jgi:hypothetical protein
VKRPSLKLVLMVMCLATVPPTFFACANQGKGQRCDILDYDNGGCEPPLHCRSRAELGGAADICCEKDADQNWVLSPYDCKPRANTGSSSSGGMDGGGGMGGAGGASSSSSSSGGGGASSSSASSSSSSASSSSASSSSGGG